MSCETCPPSIVVDLTSPVVARRRRQAAVSVTVGGTPAPRVTWHVGRNRKPVSATSAAGDRRSAAVRLAFLLPGNSSSRHFYGSSVARYPNGQRAGRRRRRAWVEIAAATLSGNSLRQTVHTHRASVRQEAKLVAALLRVARVTAGLAESNGSLPPGL